MNISYKKNGEKTIIINKTKIYNKQVKKPHRKNEK